MRGSGWICGLGLMGLVGLMGGGGAAADEAEGAAGEQEPLQQFVVTIGGTTMTVEAGEVVTVTIGGEERELKIEPTGERTFDNGVVSFTYIDEMAFAYDGSVEGLRQWYFDGQDAIIILQHIGPELGFEEYRGEFISELAAGYGPMFDRLDPAEIELGGQTLAGNKITAKIVNMGVVLNQYVYFIERGDTGVALILQDTLTEQGVHTAEFDALVERLKASLRWNEAGNVGE